MQGNGLSLSDRHVCGKSKREVYGWQKPGEGGEFMWLDKNLLNVDPTYQRSKSQVKVDTISREFSWPALGCILVALRSDARYFVYDGQHRVMAAKRRDDVQELPCLVFHFDELSAEAQAFVQANTVRGAVSIVDKFRARIEANDADALAMAAIAERYRLIIPAKQQTGPNVLGGFRGGLQARRRPLPSRPANCG